MTAAALDYGAVGQSALRPVSLSSAKNLFALAYLPLAAAPNTYLAPLCVVLFGSLAFVQMMSGSKVHESPPWIIGTFVFLGYMIMTGLVSGLGVAQVFSPSAIRYDANIFYSFLPLFVLGTGAMSLERLDRWARASVVFGVLVYEAFMVALGTGPFTSHNAMGGYYMVLLSYLLARSFSAGWRANLVPLVLASGMLWISASRGSVLGVVGVLAVYAGLRLVPRLTLVALLLVPVVFFAAIDFAYDFWVANSGVYVHNIVHYSEHADTVTEYGGALGDRSATILHRFFFIYPMALDMFYQSPTFGLGFTRFDDYPMRVVEVLPGLRMNVTDAVRHSDLHAHNSYLHVMAEGGLVGLALLAAMLAQVLRAFKGNDVVFLPAAFVVGSLLVASFTEHRLTTPSQAAPAFVIVGLLWAVRCTRRRLAEEA